MPRTTWPRCPPRAASELADRAPGARDEGELACAEGLTGLPGSFYGMQRTRNFCVAMMDSHQVMDLVLDPEFVTYCTEASMLWDGFDWSLFQPDEDSQEALKAWAATAATLA